MGFLLQPWFLILFAVVMFFVFLTIGTKEDSKDQLRMTRFTRWLIVGIYMVVAVFAVCKVLQDHNRSPFHSGTQAAPITAR